MNPNSSNLYFGVINQTSKKLKKVDISFGKVATRNSSTGSQRKCEYVIFKNFKYVFSNLQKWKTIFPQKKKNERLFMTYAYNCD